MMDNKFELFDTIADNIIFIGIIGIVFLGVGIGIVSLKRSPQKGEDTGEKSIPTPATPSATTEKPINPEQSSQSFEKAPLPPEPHKNKIEKPVSTPATVEASAVIKKPTNAKSSNQSEYQQYYLFLVIDSNKLNPNIQKNKSIQKELLSSIISKAEFGYAHAEEDKEGEKRAQTIWYEDGDIDYTRTDSVVLKISVSAKSAITNPKADSLAIRRSIQPNEDGKVIDIQKLKWGYFSGSGDIVFHTIN